MTGQASVDQWMDAHYAPTFPPPRPGTAQARTVDLLDLIDRYARDGGTVGQGLMAGQDSQTGDLQAIRWLVEILHRIVTDRPLLAEVAELYVVHAAEDLDLIEREP